LSGLKIQLNEIIDEKIKGSILRSKALFIEGNEKNTKYFANLEKKQAEKKTIYKLKVNNQIKLMKGKALRKHSLHEKTAASVLLKLFISGNE